MSRRAWGGGRAGLAAAVVAALVAGGCTAEEPPSQSRPSAAEPTSPPTTPRSTESSDPPPDPPPGRVVTVTVVGDIMLGRAVADAAAAAGDPAAPLRPMSDRLARAHITVGNLESTLSTAGAPRQGDDSFAAPPAVMAGLRAAGFDVLSLANNHTGDFGRRALVQTVRRVRTGGVSPLGAGSDRATAWRPVVVERRGVRVGLLAFNAIGETWRAGPHSAGAAALRMQPRTGAIVPAELRRLQGRVRALAGRTDVVVVLPHWGDQYTHEPVPDQRRVGRALLDAGATVVVGGHPHWVQEVQRHRGGIVAHSLGNFVFDMDTRETREGVVLDLTFRGSELARADLTPYVIGADFTPRPVQGVRARAILAAVEGLELMPGSG